MRNIARLNDITFGTCKHPSHPVPIPASGKIVTGSPDITIDGRPVARINDLVVTSCGHYDYIIGYRKDIFGNNKEFARLNDLVGKNGIYNAKIITASGTSSTL